LLAALIQRAYKDVAERFGLTPDNCPKHPSNYTADWIEKDFARGVIYCILERDDRPVGCAAIENAGPEICYLERLAVLPDYRRNGYGRKLADHVLTKAKARGAKQVGIGIIAEQTDLKQWYQKIGFVEGETKKFEHLPFQVTFMTYRLQER
jgi:N-acetylglutamate synthase-like GNAT family acetyltransferase